MADSWRVNVQAHIPPAQKDALKTAAEREGRRIGKLLEEALACYGIDTDGLDRSEEVAALRRDHLTILRRLRGSARPGV
jgi:hypothetical protein